jgi:pimeloyl-ACP methyl ester carboxylesterase
LIHGGWRIQQHARTQHCRLLDSRNVRQAWGTYAECRRRFDELKQQHELAPLKPTVVITLHGLGRTRRSMRKMAAYLATECQATSLNMSYASTRRPVADHARALQHVLDNLEGVEEIHLVGHSLGSIVIRSLLAEQQRGGGGHDPRIRSVVMLAPPNNGAAMARLFNGNKLFELIAGSSGIELGEEEFAAQLATPRCPFGIIAASTRGGKGLNPLIAGDDDLIVGVDETRLAGAHDFLIVPCTHTWIMDQSSVQQATVRFLKHGYFATPEKKQPIRAASGGALAPGPLPQETGG